MDEHTNEIKALILKGYPTESALARKLGWTRQRLNKLTTGDRLPTIEEVNDISMVTGVSVKRLIQIFLHHKLPNG